LSDYLEIRYKENATGGQSNLILVNSVIKSKEHGSVAKVLRWEQHCRHSSFFWISDLFPLCWMLSA